MGDIHGRYDLFKELMARIETHSTALPPSESLHIVLLGDLIDRGPNAFQVLKSVYSIQKRTEKMIVLMGNHEDLMLRALDGEPGVLRVWSRSGGAETLRSLGFEPPQREDDEREYISRVKTAIPPDLIKWMRRMPLSAASGDYFFCHAGVRPGVSLRRQKKTDLLWIRDDFLDEDDDFGAVIVHGHSISTEVDFRDNRIGIDTGAYATNVLTALYLEGTDREIITN